jgi:hypothetical protein
MTLICYVDTCFRLPQNITHTHTSFCMGRDSSVGIATDYELDDRMIGVRLPAEAGNFSLRHRIQIGSGAHLASHPMSTGVSFPGARAAVAWS